MNALSKRLVDVKAWALRKYLRSRTAMLVLRRHPRFAYVRMKRRWVRLVVDYDEAIRVLREDRGFAVPYLTKMHDLNARFVLGLPRSANHTRQRRALERALNDDAARRWLEHQSRNATAEALAGNTRIEIVGMTGQVLLATVGEYLGTGDLKPVDTERAKAVFREVFINPLDLPHVRAEAETAAGALCRLVREEVAERQVATARGAAPGRDVLARLLTASRDTPRLRADELDEQLVGLLVAWVASVPRGMAYAIDWLLDDEDALSRAQAAARAADVEQMWDVLLEALQQRPPAPAVERRCERADAIAGHPIHCDKEVMVVLTSAMRDPEYDGTSPEVRHLPFGYGMHQCLGLGIAKHQMSAIAIELLRRPNIARGCPLKLSGPYPSRLDVTYGVAP